MPVDKMEDASCEKRQCLRVKLLRRGQVFFRSSSVPVLQGNLPMPGARGMGLLLPLF